MKRSQIYRHATEDDSQTSSLDRYTGKTRRSSSADRISDSIPPPRLSEIGTHMHRSDAILSDLLPLITFMWDFMKSSAVLHFLLFWQRLSVEARQIWGREKEGSISPAFDPCNLGYCTQARGRARARIRRHARIDSMHVSFTHIWTPLLNAPWHNRVQKVGHFL